MPTALAATIAIDRVSHSYGHHNLGAEHEPGSDGEYRSSCLWILRAVSFSWYFGTLAEIETLAMVAWSETFSSDWLNQNNRDNFDDMISANTWGGVELWIEMVNEISEIYNQSGVSAASKNPMLRRLAFVLTSAIAFHSAQTMNGGPPVFDNYALALRIHATNITNVAMLRHIILTN